MSLSRQAATTHLPVGGSSQLPAPCSTAGRCTTPGVAPASARGAVRRCLTEGIGSRNQELVSLGCAARSDHFTNLNETTRVCGCVLQCFILAFCVVVGGGTSIPAADPGGQDAAWLCLSKGDARAAYRHLVAGLWLAKIWLVRRRSWLQQRQWYEPRI